MKVAATVEEVIGSGGDFLEDGSEPRCEPTNRGNRVEFVFSSECGDGVNVDVVVGRHVVCQCRQFVFGQDEVHLALSGEATRHFDSDLGVSAHRAGWTQSKCKDDETVLHSAMASG